MERQQSDFVLRRMATAGAVTAALGWFPAALIVGGLYRFPIPFAGYASAVRDVFWAALVYWVSGGFLVLAAVGALIGWWVTRRTGGEPPARALVYGLSLAAALLAAVAAAAVGPLLR
jgi:hypothetical protein